MLQHQIEAVQISPDSKNTFAVFCADRCLYLYERQEAKPLRLAALPFLDPEKSIRLYVYPPYVCVSERYGLNAAVVDSRTCRVRRFTREDYHADVSSYSIGFLERNGHVLLLHQTQWNRLDITDLDTGRLLTEREVIIGKTQKTDMDQDGNYNLIRHERINYLDCFHSLLHVSPDQRHFLCNGWVWSPVAIIRCFSVERFFREYEPGSVGINIMGGYNWDRPVTFLDNDRFVVAADDVTLELDGEDLETYRYRQLQFYRLSDIGEEPSLQCYKEADCNAFPLNRDGEAHGALHYDPTENRLVAVNASGAYLISLEGTILKHNPVIRCKYRGEKAFPLMESAESWVYSPAHRLFYQCNPEQNQVEILPIEQL